MAIHTSGRETVEHLDPEYSHLLANLNLLVRSVPVSLLYQRPPLTPVGENILKCAAVVEQTCGGLTANLWDDPFEWTLPEQLSTVDRIVEYLTEVDDVRRRTFLSVADDDALLKFIAVPSGEPRRLLSLLLETLVRASSYHGQALATLKILSDQSAHGFII